MNAGKVVAFDEAVASANYKMVDEKEFLLFIDVKRTRFSSIRPLPLRIKTQDGWEIIEEQITDRNTDAPEEISTSEKLINVDKIEVPKKNEKNCGSTFVRYSSLHDKYLVFCGNFSDRETAKTFAAQISDGKQLPMRLYPDFGQPDPMKALTACERLRE